jgi:hypothetical protein
MCSFSNVLLGGPIPSELGQLSALKFAFISDNALTGSIPRELGGWTDLSMFNADFNVSATSLASVIRRSRERC